jgi:hypothetical protein
MHTLCLPPFFREICEEHGIWDIFPCPWPGCKNGYDGDSFRAQLFSEEKNPSTYARRQWQSPVEGHYYSWEGGDLPNWFAVSKIFWNEARRLKLTNADSPALIYHYTSLEGFVGIVQSRALWMSDYSYLNDKRELTHGVETIREVIAEILQSRPSIIATEMLSVWDRELAAPSHRVCVASFSGEDDGLSQWRAYGPIAIGVDPRHLSIHAYQVNLRAVEYRKDIQRKLATVYLGHFIQAYELDLSANRLERIPDVYHRTDRLVELAAFFKDPAFRTEQEYRLAYIESPEVLSGLKLPPPPKRFRVYKSKLLPYVASDELFAGRYERRPLEIREVVLGPETDELLERGVREFLASSGLPGVVVRRSTVPYRT